MPIKEKLYCDTISCKMAFALKGIMQLLRSSFEEEEINLTLEQYFILNILYNEKGLIIQDLSEIVGRDKSAISRHIHGLEEHHFVARTKDPADKRRKILLVTKQGAEILEEAKKMEAEISDSLTSHIPSAKLAEFEKHITDIYDKAVAASNS